MSRTFSCRGTVVVQAAAAFVDVLDKREVTTDEALEAIHKAMGEDVSRSTFHRAVYLLQSLGSPVVFDRKKHRWTTGGKRWTMPRMRPTPRGLVMESPVSQWDLW